MFDRKAYEKRYFREKRERRKAEGLCVTCGVKLTFECTTLQCEHCREKQKYTNIAKVNIQKRIAEAKADTVLEMEALIREKLLDRGLYIRAFDHVLKAAAAEVLAEMEEEADQ